MKREIFIKLNKITDIEAFCRMASMVDGGVLLKKGHFQVDATSLLGVISINPPTGAYVIYDQTEDTLSFDDFVDSFSVEEN